jgi:hypothetical protein
MTVTDTTAAPQLTAADRCDRCGAQAFIRVVLPSGQDLLFCSHHGRKHEQELRALGGEWLDESNRLPELSAN